MQRSALLWRNCSVYITTAERPDRTMELTLYCAVPFYSNNLERRHELIIRNAADIVETLLRDESSSSRTNKQTKPGLAELTYRRRRPSTSRSSRRSARRTQPELSQREGPPPPLVTPSHSPSQEVEKWRNVGSSLRQIADNFGAGLRRTGGQPVSCSDGLMSALITFLLWKLVKKTFI